MDFSKIEKALLDAAMSYLSKHPEFIEKVVEAIAKYVIEKIEAAAAK